MTQLFFLKPGVKLIPSESLAIVNRKIVPLSKKRLSILNSLSKRPLFASDLKAFSRPSWNRFLVSVQIKRTEKSINNILKINYIGCKKSQAELWKLDITSETVISWGDYFLKLRPGHYVLNVYFPDSIVGSFKVSYFKAQRLSDLRDRWILTFLQKNKFAEILELGCGKDPRLALQILKKHSQIKYMGIDKRVKDSTNFIQGDFLKSIPKMQGPHLVIAEEVFEHLKESKLIPLIRDLKENGANTIIFTTPNRDFNINLGLALRHKGHHFEWDRPQLYQWIDLLKSELECRLTVRQIGNRIKGAGPSWGIIIKLF